MAKLSKKKRRKVKRRAAAEVARETAGSTAPARAAMGQANRDYGRNVSDARGAQRTYKSQLNNMLSNVKSSGLTGRYAAQTVNDLRSRKLEAAAGVPYAIQEAQRTRDDALASARADLLAAQAAQQEAVGVRQTQLLNAARKAKTARVGERRDEASAAAEAAVEGNRGVMNAMMTAKNYLDAAAAKDGRDGVTMLLKNKGAFITGVAADTEGADAVDSREAVNKLIRRFRRDTIVETFEPFGIDLSPKKRR